MSILLFLFACGEKVPDTATDPQIHEPSEPSEPSEPDTPIDYCAETDATGFRFEGTVEFSDGSTADGSQVRVQMCKSSCFPASWGENGFCFPEGTLDPGTYAFDVVPFGKENHATPLSFITISEDQELLSLEEPVIVPEFQHSGALVDGDFDAGGGLSIAVSTSGFTPNMMGEEAVQSVPVDPATSGLPLEGIAQENIVGMWFLGPFESALSPAWSFTVSDSGLTEGDSVQILNADYEDKQFHEMGTATVNADGLLVSDSESGIGQMTTLILVKP